MQRLIAALVAVMVCSGCIRATTVITVKQDGSGTIQQDIGANPQTMALLRNLSSSGGDLKPGADMQMFGPEQAKTAAAAMGVRFLSGEPIKTAESEGYRANFAFDDVSQIKLNLSQLPGPDAGRGAAASAEPPLRFEFSKRDATSVLTIRMAEGKSAVMPSMPLGGGSEQENAQAMAMVLPMLRGLFIDVTLKVDGTVVKSSTPAAGASQFTLLQLDFDKVAATEGAMQKLQKVTDASMLKEVPGIRVLNEPVVTIEFGK